jgi:hypothetical protein
LERRHPAEAVMGPLSIAALQPRDGEFADEKFFEPLPTEEVDARER